MGKGPVAQRCYDLCNDTEAELDGADLGLSKRTNFGVR